MLHSLAEIPDVAHERVELLLEILGLEQHTPGRGGVGIGRRERVEHVVQAPAEASLSFHR